MTAKSSYYTMLEGREYYFLVAIVILAANTIFVCPRERRFQFGLYLNLAVTALVLGYLACSWTTYSHIFDYEVFDIPGFSTPDIYSFPDISFTVKLSTVSLILAVVSIWFFFKAIYSLLHKKMCARKICTLIIAGIITVGATRPIYIIYKTKQKLSSRIAKEHNHYLAKLIATEEKTLEDAESHPKYWGAQYMRAQYLYFTNRKAESVKYYEKTLELLGDDEGQIDEFIKERLEGLR